jgi:hypothetical protein
MYRYRYRIIGYRSRSYRTGIIQVLCWLLAVPALLFCGIIIIIIILYLY